jgi:alpha-D-ribose 1-methylphosphonate 5-triphosphate synthase subunit PhnH
MPNSNALKTNSFGPKKSTGQLTRDLLKMAMLAPGRIHQLDDDQPHSIGLFPATRPIIDALLDGGRSIYVTGTLSPGNGVEFLEHVDLPARADVVLCNEQDCPNLETLMSDNGRNRSGNSTLMIQCRSFFSGILYHAAAKGSTQAQKLRCSAFNGPLVHQRQKLIDSNKNRVDLLVVCGRQFFCIPADAELVTCAR